MLVYLAYIAEHAPNQWVGFVCFRAREAESTIVVRRCVASVSVPVHVTLCAIHKVNSPCASGPGLKALRPAAAPQHENMVLVRARVHARIASGTVCMCIVQESVSVSVLPYHQDMDVTFVPTCIRDLQDWRV